MWQLRRTARPLGPSILLLVAAIALNTCGGVDTNAGPPDDPDVEANNIDMSWWAAEGSDPWVDDVMVFDALREFHLTPTGNGPRHELKIDIPRRVAMTEAYEDFSADIEVDLDAGGKTIVAQHHASGTGTIVKLYVSDSDEQGLIDSVAANGVFDVYVRLAAEDGTGEVRRTLGTIRSGDRFHLRILNDHGHVFVWADGPGFDAEADLRVEDSPASFLKFGNYLQAQHARGLVNITDPDDWPEFFDDAGIDTAVVTFSNIDHVRIID